MGCLLSWRGPQRPRPQHCRRRWRGAAVCALPGPASGGGPGAPQRACLPGAVSCCGKALSVGKGSFRRGPAGRRSSRTQVLTVNTLRKLPRAGRLFMGWSFRPSQPTASGHADSCRLETPSEGLGGAPTRVTALLVSPAAPPRGALAQAISAASTPGTGGKAGLGPHLGSWDRGWLLGVGAHLSLWAFWESRTFQLCTSLQCAALGWLPRAFRAQGVAVVWVPGLP